MKEYRITIGKKSQPSFRSHFFVIALNESNAYSQAKNVYLRRGEIIVRVEIER